MHYRRLGQSGIKISEISLGSWVTFGAQVNAEVSTQIIRAAYDQGVNFFDCADMYANGEAEDILGKAIRDFQRETLVLSSKVFWPTFPGPNGRGLSRKHIMESIHSTLRRMGTDYVDLYFCHRYDPDTPLEEVVRAMTDLVQQGKVLYWGTSEWRASQIATAYGVARQFNLVPPTMEQPQYNMFRRRRVEISLAPICKELGIGLTTWSPLFFGILTGKYNEGIPDGSRASLSNMAWVRDDITPERIQAVRELTKLAHQMRISMAQLAIAWVLRRKDVDSVITGATRLEQLNENIAAADHVDMLTNDVEERIEHILGNQPEEE